MKKILKSKWLLLFIIFASLFSGMIYFNYHSRPYNDENAMQLLSRYETELTAIAKYLLQEIPEKNMYWNISDFEEDLPEDIEKNMNTYFSEIGRGTHIIIVREDEIHFLISHANIGKDEETKNLLQFSQRLIYVRGDVTNEQFVDNREEYVSKRDHITVILLGTVHLKGNWFFGSYIAN